MTYRCPHCGTLVQRTETGRLIDGYIEHLRVVHQLAPLRRLSGELDSGD